MPHTTRKWELFPGRNKFYFNGRIMMAPDVNVFYINVFLIVSTTLLFVIFNCPYLAINVSPLIPIATIILFIFVMSALLRTSFTDPGIIPRATQDEAVYIEKQIKMQNCGDADTDRPPPRTKEVIIRGQTVKLKYCFTCRIFRPPRASHCSLCDNCVEHFDHHCPWVGNCVGRRNYRYFYAFIIFLSIYIVFVFICTCVHLYLLSENRLLLDAISESPTSVIVLLVTFFSSWSVFGLAGFHTYLAASNQTTNEDIKGSFAIKRGGMSRNPYSLGGVCSNCCYVLCGPVPASLIDRRGFVSRDMNAVKSGNNNEIARENLRGYTNVAITRNSSVFRYNMSPTLIHNGIRTVSNPALDKAHQQYSPYPSTPGGSVHPSLSYQYFKTIGRRSRFGPNNDLRMSLPLEHNGRRTPASNFDSQKSTSENGPNGLSSSSNVIDISKIALDLDDVLPQVECRTDKSSSLSMVPLSASRLQYLQDTTMIESALDLDSLDESSSSIGANSNSGLLKNKGPPS